ncbi:MAG: MBL fold metallo-hydrolase [Gammaproteobacteria bacterium]|nr:MBL fold metallo-hydrolase [Gammaproteobacteria bacterium]MDE2346430.1 MBL fold metallo-hydrolase [Gammaproteobacteria bacterium]
MPADIRVFFHKPTSTFSYVVTDPATRCAAVIDPALDYDSAAGRTGTVAADEIIAHIKQQKLKLEWILETHAHADHLSAAQHIKKELGGRIAIGEGICQVQANFTRLFNITSQVPSDGGQFDHLFKDDEKFFIGGLQARVLATPGHTSDSLTYVVGDAAFVGDTLFMPDSGTARCDFPGGDAGQLYDSIQRILALPADTRLFMCHDYAPGGREYLHQTTVAEQKRGNIHVHDGVSRQEYIQLRTSRDQTLKVPALLLPAVQVNIRAGRLPEPEANGSAYLKIPLNRI